MYSPNPDPAAMVWTCGLISKLTEKFYPLGIAILLRIATFVIVLSDFLRNLMVHHPIDGFNAHDASVEIVFVEPLLQFPLGLTGTEYQNRLCIANTRNDRIVIDIELSGKPSLATVIGRYLLSFMGTFKRRITRAAELSLHLRYDQSYLFLFVPDSHNNGLLMINPQTHVCSHRCSLLCLSSAGGVTSRAVRRPSENGNHRWPG